MTTPVLVQQAVMVRLAGDAGASWTISLPTNATAGNTLVLTVSMIDANQTWSLNTPTATGDTFSAPIQPTGDAAGVRVRAGLSIASLITGGAKTVTFSIAGASAGANRTFCVGLQEWDSNLTNIEDAAARVLGIDLNVNATFNSIGPSAALAQTDNVAFAVFSLGGNSTNDHMTTPTGWTNGYRETDDANFIGFASEYRTTAATTALSASWPHDAEAAGIGAALIAVFKAKMSVSVTLNGQAVTLAAGSMLATRSRALTGIASPGVAGTMVATRSRALTGIASPGVAGTMVAARSFTLTGVASPGVAGTLAPTIAAALTGASSPLVAGTLTPAVAVTLAGVSSAGAVGSLLSTTSLALTGGVIPSAAGTVTAGTGGNVTVALTGLAINAVGGGLGLIGTLPLSGLITAATIGTLVPTRQLAVAGLAAIPAAGTLAPAVALPVTGAATVTAPGALTAAHGVVLAGGAAGSAVGSMGLLRGIVLAGASSGATPGAMGPGSVLALTGAAAALAQGQLTPNIALGLVGVVSVSSPGTVAASTGLNLTLTGSRIASVQGIVRAVVFSGPPVDTIPVHTLEGSPASWNTRAQVAAGQGAIVAGPQGLAVGRFGWVDSTTGQASNVRTSAQQLQGFVLAQPRLRNSQGTYFQSGRWWVRPGLPVTLVTRGEFWARFDAGAVLGQRVFARLVDGAIVSGYADGAESTPFTVLRSCAPGELTVISTWSTVTP